MGLGKEISEIQKLTKNSNDDKLKEKFDLLFDKKASNPLTISKKENKRVHIFLFMQ